MTMMELTTQMICVHSEEKRAGHPGHGLEFQTPDGCRDETEDADDDNDGICDAGNFNENCQISTMSTDLCLI